MADSVQFLVDGVNEDTRKNKNFFAVEEKEVVASLKENETLKFLVKVTNDEVTFNEFVRNINVRGIYQLYENIRTLAVDQRVNSARF